MKGVYDDFENTRDVSIKERIAGFKRVAMNKIRNGANVSTLKGVIKVFERDELYEAAQGVKEAIEEYENNGICVKKDVIKSVDAFLRAIGKLLL